MQSILDALQWISNFFGQGGDGSFTSWFQEAYAWALEHYLIWKLHAELSAMQFAWGVAKGILNDLGIATQLAAAWGAVPEKVMSGLNFFHVPEAVSILINAGVTRFVMRFMPFV